MGKYFLGNPRYMSYFSWIALFFIFYAQIRYASPYAATWDQVDFALALDRYDLLAMQPHFPGYPYFVLGGMLVHQIVGNPAQALAIFNAVMLAAATAPIFWLAHKYGAKEMAWLVTALVQSASYIALIGSQPMSEGAALAVLWWYMWAVEEARERGTRRAHLLASFFFSVLLGIRLSYVPFAFALVLLWWDDWKKRKRTFRLFLFAAAAFVFQLIWVAGVAWTEGSLSGFLKLALSFTSGHFEEWGNTAVSGDAPFFHRFVSFMFYNIIWIGIANKNVWLLIGYLAILMGAFLFGRSCSLPRSFFAVMAAYFVWALVAQNIDKPRHALPLIHFAIFYGALCLFQRSFPYQRFLAVIVIVGQIAIGTFNMREQALQLPATYQLAHDLQQKKEPFVLYTWEEARVLEYLRVKFPYERVFRFSFFLQHHTHYKDAKIYLTDHVVKGFEAQGISVAGRVRKVKTYRSSTLADPVYGNITLYEWSK